MGAYQVIKYLSWKGLQPTDIPQAERQPEDSMPHSEAWKVNCSKAYVQASCLTYRGKEHWDDGTTAYTGFKLLSRFCTVYFSWQRSELLYLSKKWKASKMTFILMSLPKAAMQEDTHSAHNVLTHITTQIAAEVVRHCFWKQCSDYFCIKNLKLPNYTSLLARPHDRCSVKIKKKKLCWPLVRLWYHSHCDLVLICFKGHISIFPFLGLNIKLCWTKCVGDKIKKLH